MKILIASKKNIAVLLLVAVMLTVSVFAVGATDAKCVYLGRTPRKVPIYSVGTEEKVCALSFDACWGADKTKGILDVLTEYDVRANFFVVGIWVEKYADMLKTLSGSGRIEVGTHSSTHPDMAKLPEREMRLELEASLSMIEGVTGGVPELFRAPYGSYSDALLTTAEDLGLYTIQWDVDSLDWKGLSAGNIASRILNNIENGSIVLMHNDGEHTLEALPIILDGLKNKGFTCVTIGDMIYRENYEIDHTGKQIQIRR